MFTILLTTMYMHLGAHEALSVAHEKIGSYSTIEQCEAIAKQLRGVTKYGYERYKHTEARCVQTK